MSFVDTGAWYAAYVRSDPAHAIVKQLIDNPGERLVTTDFVLAETLNLLQARGEVGRATILGQQILTRQIADLVQVSASDVQKAFVYFSTQHSRGWSFTDCTSFVVMQRLGINRAISLDAHFRQMPGIVVAP